MKGKGSIFTHPKIAALMKNILVLGAGMSTAALITYLLNNRQQHQWQITIADKDINHIKTKIGTTQEVTMTSFDLFDENQKNALISQADVVVSMMPARFHIHVAEACLKHQCHMVTASYATPELKALHDQFASKGLLMLCEMGLDPGLDHMSAMKVIDHIRNNGYTLEGFETFTGGLLAPSEDDNPWQYKFTWNPRNVVLAGQGTVKFIQEGRYKYIPYHRLFRRTEIIHIPEYGYFEGYANRDSLNYLDLYNLRGIKTLFRGTFRRPGYCKAWNIFVQLGATDDSYKMEGVANMTHRQFINSFLSYNPHDSVELKLAHYMNIEIDSEEMYRLRWLNLFEETPIGLDEGTPAQILEHILRKKWTLNTDDRDMIVMWHKFDFVDQGKHRQIQSYLITLGDDSQQTAMAKTVGLPVAIATKLLVAGQLKATGVQIPVTDDIYQPVLNELKPLGIEVMEKEITLP